MSYTTEHPTLFAPNIEVRVSKRRKKTAGAHWEGDRIVVVVPVPSAGARARRDGGEPGPPVGTAPAHLHASDDQLEQRAIALGRLYLDGVAPSSIRWSSTQNKRWGSCTIQTGEIRISERLRVAPGWVLDAVVVHELAHLIEPNHSARFSELERRYPRKGDADIFLEGYGLGLHMPDTSRRTDGRDEPDTGAAEAGSLCRPTTSPPTDPAEGLHRRAVTGRPSDDPEAISYESYKNDLISRL